MRRRVILVVFLVIGLVNFSYTTIGKESTKSREVSTSEFQPVVLPMNKKNYEEMVFIHPGTREIPTLPPKPTHPNPPQASIKASPAPKISGVRSKAVAQKYALSRIGAWQYSCLYSLWNKESGWRYWAENKYSGAYGIPQALPGKKMASAGADWRTNPITQVKWGIRYINGRYGSACRAWNFWRNNHWY